MKIVVVDDGYENKYKITMYSTMRRDGHACAWLPFDSGFGAKANAALPLLDREYVLIGSDDFNFGDPTARPGVERLLKVMDENPTLGIASGRVDGKPYECNLERGPEFIREHKCDFPANSEAVKFYNCDLTVNYSLIRRSALGKNGVRWHDEWKIGGDHFTFFDEMKRAGWGIAYVPGVNINQFVHDPAIISFAYQQYRARARAALPSFFKRYGITHYYGMYGGVDYVPKEKQ